MICPVCGNNSPDSMTQCQFCSTPLVPTAPQQPQINTAPRPQVYSAPQGSMPVAVPQQQYAVQPVNPYMQQAAAAGMPVPVQQAMPQAPYGYAAAPSYAGQQIPQQNPYAAAPVQQSYTAVSSFVPAAEQPAAAAPVPAYQQPVQSAVQQTAAPQPSAEQPDSAEEPEEVDESTASKGTLISLFVWFAIIGLSLASVYFGLPAKIAAIIKGENAVVTPSDAVPGYEDEFSAPDDSVPAKDALYGTWVLCTYNYQNQNDFSIKGGQYNTHSVPLQFYTFNDGVLDRFCGTTSSDLTHTIVGYTYTDNVYQGVALEGGTNAPVIALNTSYMCIYDYLNIDGAPCYVEYALLRVFDEPVDDEAIRVYANAVETGGVFLPQYSSTVMTGGETLTTTSATTTATADSTYNIMGTWLLVGRQFTESGLTETLADRNFDYQYDVFSYDGTCVTHHLRFDDAMEECLDRQSDDSSFQFSDGLLHLKDYPDISVTMSNDLMYFDYIDDGVHVRDIFKFISNIEYSSKQLSELRPDVTY